MREPTRGSGVPAPGPHLFLDGGLRRLTRRYATTPTRGDPFGNPRFLPICDRVTALGGEGACAPTAEPFAAAVSAASGFFSPADPVGEGLAAPRAPPEKVAYVRPLHFPWAYLLRRVFELDVLACPDCGGRLRLVATIENPSVVARILEHLGLAVDLSSPAPVRSTEWLAGWSD